MAEAEGSEVQPGQISSRTIYEGRVVNLAVDTVRFPDGSAGELEIMRHSGAAAVLPILSNAGGEDPQILLIKQYRYAADDFLYEVPAGRLDPNESPEDCARRELLEETGCTAERIEPLYTFYTTPGFIDERIHGFIATGLTRGESKREADEFMTLETMTLSRSLELIQKGEIRDGKTTVLILFAAGFRAGL